MNRWFFTAICLFIVGIMDSSGQQQADSFFNSQTPLDIGIKNLYEGDKNIKKRYHLVGQ
jgi:hypothetical protein